MSKKRDPEVGILQYLEGQNRPYSAVDIFNNLHKEFGKTAVIKALESLAEKDQIIEKTYGKQKVYSPLQDKFGNYDENELKALDLQSSTLQENINALQQEINKQEVEIRSLSNQMSTEEALQAIEKLQNENLSHASRIEKLKSGTAVMSKEERLKLYHRKNKMVTHWKKRKCMTNDMLDCILEGYSKSKRQLLEDTGVETDEEVGVRVPSN